MKRAQTRRGRTPARWVLPVLVAASCCLARDAPARTLARARSGWDTPLTESGRAPREAGWAVDLPSLELFSMVTHASAHLRLYDRAGEIDDETRAAFEQIASRDGVVHPLAARLEQIVFKAAYHFGVPRVVVVSGWRERAGRHGTGEALDFKLPGVAARDIASYLRRLPRLGVGLYTHPGTQFVHVDVREPSFHWIDPSPPGVHMRETAIRDPQGAKRDASYEPDLDLPRCPSRGARSPRGGRASSPPAPLAPGRSCPPALESASDGAAFG
jgi:hypothetical protein